MDSLIVFAFWAFIFFRFRTPIFALIKILMNAQNTSHKENRYNDHKKKQGTTDLQALLNKLDNYNEITKTKKSEHIHSNSDYNNKNYVTKSPKKPWSNSSSGKHVHSDSNYNNKNYVPNHDHTLKIDSDPVVKRGMFDNRDTEPTIIRKDYD